MRINLLSRAKVCGKCYAAKAKSEFWKNKNHRDGLCSMCKPCDSAARAANWLIHRDSVLEFQKNNRPLMNARRRASAKRHPESNKRQCKKHYATHKESHCASTAAWRRANPEKVRANSRAKENRRRARKSSVQVASVTRVDIINRAAAFGGVCAYCGGQWSEIDHVKPIALGGAHILANLRPACKACNRRKAAQSHHIWLSKVATRPPLPLP